MLQRVNLGHRQPGTEVGALSISEKQMVEIAKAIAFNARVIVMDEPTSSLTEDEVQRLFAIIRQLKAQGKGIVFISHKLSEIAEIGDRITILKKDGGYVGTYNVRDLTTDDMVQLMVGREIKGTYQHPAAEHYQFGDVLFECNHLTRRDGPGARDVSFYTAPRREFWAFRAWWGPGAAEQCVPFTARRRKPGASCCWRASRCTSKARTTRCSGALAL